MRVVASTCFGERCVSIVSCHRDRLGTNANDRRRTLDVELEAL